MESDHPEYSSTFKSTKQSVALEFSSLQVKLHQEALLNIIDVSTKMLPPRCCNFLCSLRAVKTCGFWKRAIPITRNLVTDSRARNARSEAPYLSKSGSYYNPLSRKYFIHHIKKIVSFFLDHLYTVIGWGLYPILTRKF